MTIGSQVTIPPIPHGSVTEKAIVGKLVTDLLAAGLKISVFDGEETTVRRSADAKTIFEALASTDSDTLLIYRTDDPKRIGSILLIWGNDHDIISDYSDNATIESFVDPVQDFAEGLR